MGRPGQQGRPEPPGQVHRASGRRDGRSSYTAAANQAGRFAPRYGPSGAGADVIALTYGSGADWVRNVQAAGGCQLESRRRHYQLGAPRLYRDENATDMPAFIRFMLRRVIKAPEFLSLDIISELPAKTSSRSGRISS